MQITVLFHTIGYSCEMNVELNNSSFVYSTMRPAGQEKGENKSCMGLYLQMLKLKELFGQCSLLSLQLVSK